MLILAHKSTTVPAGADGIEFDVIKTADGDLAVSHDEKIPGQDFCVHQKTMAELRGLGFLSLRDVFNNAAAHPGPPPVLNIEIKGRDCWETAWRQTRDFCDRTGYPYDRVIFSSFDHGQLLKLRQADAQAKIGLIFGATFLLWAKPLKLHPETGGTERRASLTACYLNAVLDAIKPTSLHPTTWNAARAASYAQKHGLDLFVWASREKPPGSDDKRLRRVVEKGRDNPRLNVITDYPAGIRLLAGP